MVAFIILSSKDRLTEVKNRFLLDLILAPIEYDDFGHYYDFI